MSPVASFRWPAWMACLVALLAAGCQGLAGRPAPTGAAELACWQRPRAPVYRSASLVFAGATVERFADHAALTSWVHSQELLEQACRVWLGVPAERVATAVDPGHEDLRRLLAERLPAMVRPGDTVLCYLGTHQLKDGRLLLGNGEHCRPADLARWLAGVPASRIVLLGDFCYGAQAESADWAASVTRIYASPAGELAPDLDLDGLRAVGELLAGTRAIVRQDLELDYRRYSLLGLMTVHAMRQELAAGPPSLELSALTARLGEETRRLDDRVRRFAVPAPAVYNLAPLVLAQVQLPAPAPGGETDLKSLLDLPDDRIDVGLGNLLAGRLYDPRTDVAGGLAKLDAMAALLRERLGGERRAEEVIAVINRYLFDELGLKAEAAPYPTDFLLGELLASKRGRCTALTTLYLALGQRLDIPFRAVCIPEHVHVRWTARPGDRWEFPAGAAFLNVETTLQGKAMSDDDYRRQYGWPDTEQSRRFYQVPLTNRQTLGIFYSPLSHALLAAGRDEEAAVAGRQAVAINPADPEAWNNLGMARRRQNQPALALTCYRQALEINPRFAEAWNNLGSVETDPATRLACYRNAVGLKPKLAEAWKNLAILYFQQGQYRQAMDCAETCNQLNAPMPADFVDAIERRL